MKTTGQLLKLLPPKERQKWNGELDAMDRAENNNNRRQTYKRDWMDTTIVDREPMEGEWIPPLKMLNLSNPAGWDDCIFSRRPDDLYQLVSDENISRALKNLTSRQKEVLFLNLIHQFTSEEIAQMFGTSDANIRKHKNAALKNPQSDGACSYGHS